MEIVYTHKARVYTWPEVRDMLAKQKVEILQAMVRNRDQITQALCADHERAMLMICLRCLQEEGFQKIPMERLMDRVADMAEGLQAGKVDYDKDIRGPVEECLGYSIEDQALMERLEEEIT